jgi:hypothetical protein
MLIEQSIQAYCFVVHLRVLVKAEDRKVEKGLSPIMHTSVFALSVLGLDRQIP